jgi:hypothetical protein
MQSTHLSDGPTTTMNGQVYRRIGALCAIVGSLLNLIANLFHPKELIAYDSAAHLRTIATDQSWALDHFVFMVVAAITLWGLLALADSLMHTPGAFLASLSTHVTIIGTALMITFFVVDGYGMQAAAAVWLSAPSTEAAAALYAAILMSKLGIGFGSAYFFWYLGLLPLLYGMAMIQSGIFPRFISLTAMLGGVLGVMAGAGFYLFGFSVAALLGFIGAQAIISLWVFCAGIVLYLRSGSAR